MDATDLFRCFRALILAGLFSWSSVSRSNDFEAANQAYEAGRYEEARKGYEALLQKGERTANVYFNLANAEYRAGENGRAVLNYERALALEPAHPEARRNLTVARERTGARGRQTNWYDVMFPAWSSNVFAVTAAAAGWIAVISFVAIRFSRRRSGVVIAVGLLATLVAGYAGGGLWYTERDRKLGIVTAKEAVARLAPADQSGVAGTLPAGSRVQVLSERGDWIYCQLPGGGLGWLPARDMERVRLRI